MKEVTLCCKHISLGGNKRRLDSNPVVGTIIVLADGAELSNIPPACDANSGAYPDRPLQIFSRLLPALFYGFITGYWREKRTVWLRGGTCCAFLRKPTGFFFSKFAFFDLTRNRAEVSVASKLDFLCIQK